MSDHQDHVRKVLAAAERADDASQALLDAVLSALDARTSATKLGAVLGVGERTVRRWASEGLPRPWRLDR